MLSLLICGCCGCGEASPPPVVASPTPVDSAALVAAPPTLGDSAARVTPTAPVPTPTRAPAPPPEPTPTPYAVRVGSTASQAIYLYGSPTTGDRIQSYPEGTPLLIVGGDVEGDGLTWHVVRAPDGTEGYIPVGDTVPEAD